MDYKEKIEEAKRLYETANADQRYVLETLFPELRESEDEKVRKEIITYISTADDKELIPYETWIAWLEKQGEQKPVWSEEDECILFRTINDLKFLRDTISKDPKYAVNIIDIEREITWLKFLKDRVQPKQEWSKEDEMFVHGLIRGLAAKRDIHGHTTFSSDCIDITETINWLKSLRPQSQWKPSDEQMKALNEALCHVDDDTAIQISMLIGKLKNLREE